MNPINLDNSFLYFVTATLAKTKEHFTLPQIHYKITKLDIPSLT